MVLALAVLNGARAYPQRGFGSRRVYSSDWEFSFVQRSGTASVYRAGKTTPGSPAGLSDAPWPDLNDRAYPTDSSQR